MAILGYNNNASALCPAMTATNPNSINSLISAPENEKENIGAMANPTRFNTPDSCNSKQRPLKTSKEREEMFRSLQELHQTSVKNTKAANRPLVSITDVLPKIRSPPLLSSSSGSPRMNSTNCDYKDPLKYKESLEDNHKKKKLSFDGQVSVREIPSRHEYDEESRQQIWTSCQELQVNAERSYHEFKWDHKNWRSATEENGFFEWRQEDGKVQLVHPATYEVLYFERQQQQQQQEAQKRHRLSCCAVMSRAANCVSFVDYYDAMDYSDSEDEDGREDSSLGFGLQIEVIDDFGEEDWDDHLLFA